MPEPDFDRMAAEDVRHYLQSPLPVRQLEPSTKQIGVRLGPAAHKRLQRAAERYGVAPGTLARMLVNHGVDAILARPAASASER